MTNVNSLYTKIDGNWINTSSDSIIGEIKMYGGITIPSKWIICDGTAISRTTYSKLFSAIGTTYGNGDGSTTFNVPDFINRMPRGNAIIGSYGGCDTITLTVNNMPSHTHTVNSASTTDSGGAHTHDYKMYEQVWGNGNGSGGKATGSTYTVATTSSGEHTHTINNLTLNNTGGGESITITNPYITISFIIYAGV